MDKRVLSPYLISHVIGERFISPGLELAWSGDPWPYQYALAAAIIRLPKHLQDVVTARFGEGMSYADYGRRIGRTRERARQLEATALRRLRLFLKSQVDWLRGGITTRVITDGPLDPAWVTIKEASQITGLSKDHLRHLGNEGKVIMRRHPANGRYRQLSRISLKQYVLSQPAADGRRKGQWKED